MRFTHVLPLALAMAAAPMTTLHAQEVGHPPSETPYRDIETPQRITLFGGYFSASKDAIGAVPQSGPMFGLRYEVTVGGPAQFFTRVARINSTRTTFDPTAASGSQALGDVSVPLYMLDLGFSFDLTGHKSWHNIIPIAGFALGAVHGKTKTASDPFNFGVQFEASTEFGIRYTPRSSVEGRFTIGNMLYQTRYPNAYYAAGSGGTPLLGSNVSKNSYRNNWVMTAGLAFPIFR